MNTHSPRPWVRLVRNRRGVALPVALLGLILVTVLITSVLISSSTEVALSNAHEEATSDLYLAEGAVESYIMKQSWRLEPVADDPFTPPGSSTELDMNVVRLRETTTSPFERIYAVSAAPSRGGRQVSAMVKIGMREGELANGIDAAVTSGALNLASGGNTLISGIQDSDLCEDADTATGLALTTDVDKAKNDLKGTVEGSPDSVTTTMDRYEIANQLLGGLTPQQMAQFADVKFGFDGRPAWSNTAATSEPNKQPRTADQNDPYNTPFNWGCPADILGLADSNNTGSCTADGDELYYPVVAIDANGGKASLQGDHGQGILLVLNGSLDITGSFVYKGIIIVEGGVKFGGTGGNKGDYKIEGAVVSLGDNSFEDAYDPDTSETSQVGGNVTIRFNRCAINQAQDAYNDNVNGELIQQAPNEKTFNWSEVVR